MEIINYSSESVERIKSLMPSDLIIKKAIVFPDICETNWPLPTGISILTEQDDWRKFAISDIGCGMLLCKSEITAKDFSPILWDDLCNTLKSNKYTTGDIGTGNHFVNALVSKKDNYVYILIHCGIKKDINKLISYVDKSNFFDDYYYSILEQANNVRYNIYKILYSLFGKLRIVTDKVHNQFEITKDGVIIRRGSVKMNVDDNTIIPANLYDEVVLVKATKTIEKSLYSLCHGSGKKENHEKQDDFFAKLRNEVYIPSVIPNDKLDNPSSYRGIGYCIKHINELITIEDRYSIIAYIGKI